VCWHIEIRLESGPVTADLTTTVIHSSKLLINDIKPDHSLYCVWLGTKCYIMTYYFGYGCIYL